MLKLTTGSISNCFTLTTAGGHFESLQGVYRNRATCVTLIDSDQTSSCKVYDNWASILFLLLPFVRLSANNYFGFYHTPRAAHSYIKQNNLLNTPMFVLQSDSLILHDKVTNMGQQLQCY